MQVGVYAKCMSTNFGVHGLVGFGDIATFQTWPNFPFVPWTTCILEFLKYRVLALLILAF